MPEVQSRSSDALTVKAYAGDAKTLLAFNMRKRDSARMAGFTIEVKPEGQDGYYLFNSLRFAHPERHAQDPRESVYSSLNAPLHKFRWIHVPGLTHQGLR